MLPRVISILGPPGAGKTTLATRLSSEFQVPVITIGSRLRSLAERDTAVAAVIASGAFVSDELMWGLVEADLERAAREGALLDGFPRTLGQVSLLDSSGAPVDRLIELVADARVAERRVRGRRDMAGTSEARSDDSAKTVLERRLDIYQRMTAPVVDEYEARRRLIRIDAARSEDQVFHDAMAALAGRTG